LIDNNFSSLCLYAIYVFTFAEEKSPDFINTQYF